METIIENMNEMRKEMRNNMVASYAFNNHPLAEQDDYMKSLYFKMLCMISHYSGDVQEEQLLLLERFVIGANTEKSLPEYMRMAMNEDDAFLADFIDAFKEHQLRFPLVLDSLVLAQANGTSHPDQLTFIAELSEQLGLTIGEINYLAQLAASIIEQNMERYEVAEEVRPESISFEPFIYYTNSYVRIFLSRKSDHSYFVSFREKTRYDFSNHVAVYISNAKNEVQLDQRSIRIENVVIDTHLFTLIFNKNDNVHLINCEFIGSEDSIHFNYCRKVTIENCLFRDFSGKTIMVTGVRDIALIGCKFRSCIYEYTRGWGDLGGVIYTETPDEIIHALIDHCEFRNCGAKKSTNNIPYRGYRSIFELDSSSSMISNSSIISNLKIHVKNSRFLKCLDYKDNEPRMDGTLFLEHTVNENNEIIDSAKFA